MIQVLSKIGKAQKLDVKIELAEKEMRKIIEKKSSLGWVGVKAVLRIAYSNKKDKVKFFPLRFNFRKDSLDVL